MTPTILLPAVRSIMLAASLFGTASGIALAATGTDFDHNGSRMRYDLVAGRATINYVDPRSDLIRSGVTRGTLLFEGRIDREGILDGTAYTFASGCAPAPYPVSGMLGNGRIILKGAAPTRVRGSCAVAQYRGESPHSVLWFRALGPMPANDSFAAISATPPIDAARAGIGAPASVAMAQPEPAAAAPRPEIPASEYDRLIDAYLADRDKLKIDPAFAVAFAQYTNCTAFSRLRSNEFERERFNAAAPDFLKGRGVSSRTFHTRLAVKIGSYDFKKQVFAFKPLAKDSVYQVMAPREYGCGARHFALPEAFSMRFENYDLVDGVSVDPEEAERFVNRKIGPSGLKDDNVLMDIDIEIAGKLGDPVEVDSGGFLPVRKWISKVNGRIVDFSLFADAQARTPFARLSPERKSTYEAAKAQLQAEEQADARINQAFSWPLLARQFNALKAGEKADVRHTRLPSTGALARDVSTPAGTRFRIDQLAATYSHEQRDGAGNRIGPSLRFTNPNPLDGIELPAEISQRVSANPAAVVVNRLYQPVGVVDDEAARRSVLMAQIVAIEIEVNEGERRFRHLVPVPGDLKPFVFQRDERPVSAFEISGLKAGISPQAVEEVFGRKFGSVAEYDPKARTQRTGGSDCAAWMPNGPGRQPCATAEFDVLGRGWFGGETIGLTRLSIVQNLDAGQIDGFVAGFIKQFGEPRLKIETANTLLLSWGAVASRHRDGNADAQAALHVAEVEIRKFRGGVATRFLLTNPAYFLNRDAAASVQRTSQRSSGL